MAPKIFLPANDVLYCSIHGDPMEAFPYFLGFADETGAELGLDRDLNLPLQRGTTYPKWHQALVHALQEIRQFKTGVLVISLGVDTFKIFPSVVSNLKVNTLSIWA